MMFYGKHFATMYEGSMVGKGSMVFALMGYVISHQQPDTTFGGVVRLNVEILAATFGEPAEKVQQAIDLLCAPDLKSTTPDKEGRRLIKVGQFDYQVVNYVKYFSIRNEQDRREANRQRQAEHRAKKKLKSKKKGPLTGEVGAEQKLKSGEWTQEQADAAAAETREKK